MEIGDVTAEALVMSNRKLDESSCECWLAETGTLQQWKRIQLLEAEILRNTGLLGSLHIN